MPKPQPKPINLTEVRELALDLVQKNKFPMLATTDGNKAFVRPVSPVLTEVFTVYVANLSSYEKTRQIAAFPEVELCYMDGDHNQVRIAGKAEIVGDRALLQKIWDKNRLLEHYLGSIDNPKLIVYRVVPSKVKYMQEWALEYFEVPLE